MEITGEWSQDEPLEITTGHRVVLYGSSSEDLGRACITLPGVRVIGGSLMLVDLELTATEENRVQGGCLQCVRCSITSRNGCGVLCLQKSNVSLQGCEIMRCMRSGIGINGKNVELDVKQCLVSRNVFSGIGVNHQARSIALRDNCITQNGLHGIWLNVGVTAHWHGGDLSGNRLTDQAGAGQLVGYTAPGAE
ncbi:unnamed protein product [Prorocentrum cordatum]|nr:unnamed protein product [Polarella glacialis]